MDLFDIAVASKLAGGGGGGGGGGLELLASESFTVQHSSTTAKSVGRIDFDNSNITTNSLIIVHAYDAAGKRAGYFYDNCVFAMVYDDNQTSMFAIGHQTRSVNSSGDINASEYSYGVYANDISAKSGYVSIYTKYNTNGSKTIDGTYNVRVYVTDISNIM